MPSPSLPNELLGAIVDAAVGTFEPAGLYSHLPKDLRVFLQQVALTSHFLSRRAQHHLFSKVYLRASNYTPKKAKDTIAVFQENPDLLWHPRCLAILFKGEPEHGLGQDWDPDFKDIILPFFASNLRHLETVGLYSPFGQRWSQLPVLSQEAILNCISNNPLTRFSVLGVDLPVEFGLVLPSTLVNCNLASKEDKPSSLIREYFSHHKETLHLGRSKPTIATLNDIGWAFSQKDFLFDSLTSLSLDPLCKSGVGLPELLAKVSKTLVDLVVRYRGPIGQFHGSDPVRAKALFSTLEFPKLDRLGIIISCYNREDAICPPNIALLILSHFIPTFSTIRHLRIEVSWHLPPGGLATSQLQAPHSSNINIKRLMERQPQGFAHVDDILSERKVFQSLKSVDLAVKAAFSNQHVLDMDSNFIKALQDQLRQDAGQVFHKTSRVLERFSISTCRAFVRAESVIRCCC